jgi:hypothetical protein
VQQKGASSTLLKKQREEEMVVTYKSGATTPNEAETIQAR